MKLLILILFFALNVSASNYPAKISPITKKVKTRMIKGNSWGEDWSPVKDYQHFEYLRK